MTIILICENISKCYYRGDDYQSWKIRLKQFIAVDPGLQVNKSSLVLNGC
ncbi:MAG: hypothetical protein CM15mP104_2530 [Gammaproteobacteria bacterium]|nr:MAG: hypothetical protein CM15mP104_2530 [Gammaproteobacteria bacterium]